MIGYVVGGIAIALWILVLRVFRKTNLRFWRYTVGSAGVFIIGLVVVMPLLTEPLARIVALMASVPGKVTSFYSAYYKYSSIMIASSDGAISLTIDFECSGIIEILAFVALLAFFSVYSVWERIWVGISGVLYIILANAFRIVVIAMIIHFGGIDKYYIAHTYVGRIVFYGLSVVLYFYTFTRPQITHQRVGTFKYDAD